ncbi:hypothetical protein [Mesorhizobium escarrei]|uniref:ATP-binding protein n=1 Tax=Mesorhizobium escarrei TaxID=666018 RepID=A0ABN8K145_9HYPH|nr:hypothetical protein [Mesorhizobium escarrei]CAH2403058.1 conserved hypothetical protein [Mesorhizobium escarrei]
MKTKVRRGTGGGRATAGGVVFQSGVGACAASALLANRPASRIAIGLPGLPRKVRFETPSAVDDLTIETDIGRLYVQAKRTIALSPAEDSELASVAVQFVRQYQQGADGISSRRALNTAEDRLVLAVSDQAVGTIKSSLREVLDRCRTGAATGLPNHLQSAHAIFSEHIRRAWLEVFGEAITDAEKQSVLSLCCVIVIGDSQRQVAEEALRDIVASAGDETGLFDLLVSWAADAAQRGIGGDTAAIRLALAGRVRLIEPPNYRDDVARLRTYSAETLKRLKRFAAIEAPEGPMVITRPIVDLVARGAVEGSLALTGEPGSGKSAILREAALRLSSNATVVVLAVDASAISLDALRLDIGLKHQLIDVLSQMPTEKGAYLLLDALDAVRGGAAEATYKKLVELVGNLDGWHVVASVRTFDLRLGRDWKRLFAGTPPEAAHADQNFPAVRHIHVPTLGAEEKADIAAKSPMLSAAIVAGGSKMEALATNPFNLALVGDLLRSGVSASSLAHVATRGELLSRYWDERISHLGTPATVSLRSVLMLMISGRSVDIPETSVPAATASTVDELQRAGVLVTESTRRIGFRHHVLFDYAVARLTLLPDRNEALPHLSRATGAGLLISPSLGYWLEDLKKDVPASDYWCFIVALVSNEDIDPIVRVEVARIAVESVQETEDVAPLVGALTTTDPRKERAFQYLVGYVLAKGYQKHPIMVRPWAALVAQMTAPNMAQIGSMRGLIGTLLENDPDPESFRQLGTASRKLFDIMSADESRIPWLTRHAIPFVAKTFATDPLASAQRLNQIFDPDRFAKFGHIEVPALADKVIDLAPDDDELVLGLFRCVFRGGEFSRDQTTSMSGSWILSLTSNAAQDFAMASYSLATAFPQLLQEFPRVALRALATAFHAQREKEHAGSDKPVVETIRIAGEERSFEEDHSQAWAWDIDEKDHDDFAKLYRTAMAWVDGVTDNELLRAVPSMILRETSIALAWRTVFDLASRQPVTLGASIWPTQGDKRLLYSLDTRRSAIAAIAATYPYLSGGDRERAEAEWLALDFPKLSRPDERRKEILGTLFATIGENRLATEAARSYLRDVRKDGSAYENRKPFAITTRWGSDDDDSWLARQGVNTKAPETANLLVLASVLRAARDAYKQEESDAKGAALCSAAQALDEAISAQQSLAPPVEQDVLDALAEGFGRCLAADLIPGEHRSAALARLLIISEHAHPKVTADTEEKFARFQSWGSPSPRVEAAQALALLIGKAEFWPEIKDRFEAMLLQDSHPAVRFQLVYALPCLSRVDRDEMWRLAKEVTAQELNPAILRLLTARLPGNTPDDANQLEPLALDLSHRLTIKEHGEDPIVGLITFFAINHARPASVTELNTWLSDVIANEARLQRVLFDIRDDLLLGLNTIDPRFDAIRRRANEFIERLITTLEPAVRSWPLSGKEPTPLELSALKLFNEIADQIYYAVGHDVLSPVLEERSAQVMFLAEYAPLISKLTTLGTPRAVHHLLDVLSKLMPVAPDQCFDLMAEAMLRTTGVARYEHESMGADLFVQLVGRFLADYRAIFDDQARRNKLIDCIAVFVEAGWPEARRLFQSLPELLQ